MKISDLKITLEVTKTPTDKDKLEVHDESGKKISFGFKKGADALYTRLEGGYGLKLVHPTRESPDKYAYESTLEMYNHMLYIKNKNLEIFPEIYDITYDEEDEKVYILMEHISAKNSKSDYFISKFDSEQLIINSGLDYTIFRPSYIIGKDDYLTLNIQKQIRQKKIWIPDAGQYVIQPITINDACKIIHIATESKSFSKKIIDLVGPEKIPFKQFLKNSTSNSNVPIETISVDDAYHKASTDRKFPYGIEDLNILLGDFKGNYEKLKKLSGINFSKIRSI